MGYIRFVSPTPDLEIPAVPALFVDYIYDIDETDEARLGRMRYRGAPYGVIELGIADEASDPDGLTYADVAAGILNQQSTIGQAVTQRLEPVNTEVGNLRGDVNELLARPEGSGVIVGVELPAELSPGTLAARLRSY